jgi:LysM repeat protein
MSLTKKNILFVLVCLICLSLNLKAQIKSTQIENIDGKKFYIHKIEKSQSLYAISKMYNVSIEEIYILNPILKKNGIKAYQEIKIPANTNLSVTVNNLGTSVNAANIDTNKYFTHKVIKGETVYSICNKFGINDKQLNQYNPSSSQGLKEGQLLIVGEKNKKKINVAPNFNKPQYTVKDAKQTAAIIDSSVFKTVSKPKKTNYNIALILPFRLDEIINLDLNELVKNKNNFPNVPALAFDFYLGFKRACDSLQNKDFELQIQIFDIDDKDTLKLVEFANNPKFKNYDMIFGPLFAGGFKKIAKKAREFHIPIISPLTEQNKILYNNIYVSKTNPSKYTLLENLADFCLDSLRIPDANIILLMPGEKEKKELQFAIAFKKYYNEKVRLSNKSAKDTLIIIKDFIKLKDHLKSNLSNVIITLSTNEVFIADFTTQLGILADKKDVTLCGWESLRSMDNLDQSYLNQLKFTFPSQYNLTNVFRYDTLMLDYHATQNTLPSEYFLIGFENAYYYLKNLKEIGPDFVNNLTNYTYESNYMRFKFFRPDITTGFDNRGVYIFRYNNFQLQKTGWK